MRRFTDAELDEIAEITEDWCPPWDEWQAILAQAKRANKRPPKEQQRIFPKPQDKE